MMGNRKVVIDDQNNIHIDNVVFKGTKSLWNLIMNKTSEDFEHGDLENYKEILQRTNVIDILHETSTDDRSKNTAKYRFFKEIDLVHTPREAENLEEDILLKIADLDTAATPPSICIIALQFKVDSPQSGHFLEEKLIYQTF